MKKIKTAEILIIVFTFGLILLSEYYYLIQGNVDKAIFIGLWPPTIVSLLNYFNSKTKN